MVLTKVEELRSAFEADDYFTLGKIVRTLVWEDDVEARYQLPVDRIRRISAGAGKWRQEASAAWLQNIGR
jgi:hypothetical protein